MQWLDDAGNWRACITNLEDMKSATAILEVMDRQRSFYPDTEYRVVFRDLPPFQPLNDGQLDELVVAEATTNTKE